LPRYDYHCPQCDNTFEVTQSFDSEPVADCPACGSRSHRLISFPAIHFKGSGFYTTDSRSSNGASRAPSDDRRPPEKADAAAASESKSASPDTPSPSSS